MEAIERKTIRTIVNGKEHEIDVGTNEVLADVLRERLGLTGTKIGCEAGECGVCTVLLDGKPVLSCLTFAMECAEKEILTIEGLVDGSGEELHPIQESFVEKGAVQCGFCTPAMILSAKALLEDKRSPSKREIKEAINGVICRCTGYMQIVEAISSACENMRKGKNRE
jgi:carbon-monoxide dehydrogenase small subunit